MPTLKKRLLQTTAMTLALTVGSMGLIGVMAGHTGSGAALAQAKCGGCNPCAAKAKCGGCNPCAAKAACGACNPCAARGCGACNPCNPCAAGAGLATGCFVPRLQAAAACNPCAAKNPCAAACGACNPCAAKAACGACNPCAAKAACGACNPCAAKNPCAARACNPCAAGACGPCGPCGPAAEAPELTDAEAVALYECVLKAISEKSAYLEDAGEAKIIKASWSDSGMSEASDFVTWKNFATRPYVSATHGGRFVTNHANDIGAEAYGRYENVGEMPVGGIAAKPSFTISAQGEAMLDTLFLMEKASAGSFPDSNDWIYTAIMPDGSLMGRTGGHNSDMMEFCVTCHAALGGESDDLTFLPEELRVQ